MSKEFLMDDNWFSTSSFVVMTHFMRWSLVRPVVITSHYIFIMHTICNVSHVWTIAIYRNWLHTNNVVFSCHCLVHCNVTYSTGNVLHRRTWLFMLAGLDLRSRSSALTLVLLLKIQKWESVAVKCQSHRFGHYMYLFVNRIKGEEPLPTWQANPG